MPDDLLAGLRALQGTNGNGHGSSEMVAKRFGLGKKLNKAQWQKLNAAIDAWRERILDSAHMLPEQAYGKGHAQTVRFLRELGATPTGTVAHDRAAREYAEWLLRHELTGTLDKYTDQIRSAVLYGLKGDTNPTAVASALYHATKDAERDWRRVARTEMARANALGRLDGATQMGYTEVWVPPHLGSCEACKELIENKVFPVELLQANIGANWGRKRDEWVPAVPQHPHCRHSILPFVEAVFSEAQEEYAHMRESGLDDETIGEMFDSSGQLRPQYANDPRLSSFLEGKTEREPFEAVLAKVVGKVRARAATVSKGFFDPPQAGLDPLVWAGDDHLKPEVRDAILQFWTGVLGAGWELWATVYITGSATSYQWGTGWEHPWLGSHQLQTFPDVDTHLVIDYDRVRGARSMWAMMSPFELRSMLEAWALKAKEQVEVAPGMRLDAYIRTEDTPGEFVADVEHIGQGVYDVNRDEWLIRPSRPEGGEHLGQRILGGVGGRLANEHPDWITLADHQSSQLQAALDAYSENPGSDRLADLQAIMDDLYADRKAAFLEGAGQEDRGNWVWQYLENFGPLLDVKQLLHQVGS